MSVAMILTALCSNARTNGGTITLKVGEEYYVDASMGGGFVQTGSWSKSNSTFVFVSRGNKSCTIRGNQLGTGTLYYLGVAGSYDVDYYWTVNVVAPEPTSISVSPSSQIISIGDTFILTYTISPSNATTTVTWSSSNSNIASVDKNTGKVTGINAGTTYINATTSNGKTNRCEVTVEKDEEEDGEEIDINEINFPDKFFREYLLAQEYGKDQVLTKKEIRQIKSIDVSYGRSSYYGQYYGEITDLKGIEYFTFLTDLSCHYNRLTSLDVSKNTALTRLICSNNELSSIDVSKNTALKWLNCKHNQLTSLDISQNTILDTLHCSENKLTHLDVSTNKSLKLINIFKNEIKKDAMGAFISSLPPNTTGKEHTIWVYDETVKDGNTCTIKHVSEAKAKKWNVWYTDKDYWVKDYSGMSEEAAAITLLNAETEDDSNAEYYTLDGVRVEKPTKKGIYIKNGKKVVIK